MVGDDPLVAVLTSARTCAPSSLFMDDDEGAGLRGSFHAALGRVEVWCLQEMLGAAVSGSSSEEKARVLPRLLAAEDVGLVIAFGTAGALDAQTQNGCVRIGTKVF